MDADVIVVGGGPAGLMAAAAASERGSRVILCEHLEHVGMKLIATGGGHGNISNTLSEVEFMSRFGRQGRFMHPALKAMNRQGLCGFLQKIGVPTHSPDGFKILPVSNSARTVQEALVRQCRDHGVEIRTAMAATSLFVKAGAVVGLETSNGLLRAPIVILATGGLSYRELGATGIGFDMARRVGHHLVKPMPALVPLVAEEKWAQELAGVTLPQARIWVNLPKWSREGAMGGIVFTHRGVSGPAVLDISGVVSTLLEEQGNLVPVCLNPVPQKSAQEWEAIFESWHEQHGKKRISRLLDWHLPSSLAQVICELAGIQEETTASSLSRLHRLQLVRRLTSLELTITATEGFDQAMVTRGGVSLREVNPDTLESRLIKRLFFAGEVLDLDGPTGGFNLQWAFSSGFLAGTSAVLFGRPSAAT